MMTLTPANDRDYTSLKKLKADYDAGKDFILNDITNRWHGKPINKAQVEAAGYDVAFRYNNNRRWAKA